MIRDTLVKKHNTKDWKKRVINKVLEKEPFFLNKKITHKFVKKSVSKFYIFS